MSLLDQKPIASEFIKLRWLEPYASSGFNRSQFKTTPRGVYNGFVVKAGPGAREVSVVHDDPTGWDESTGYAYGAFDTASGWSVAVHSSLTGFNTTVAIQAGPDRNFVFDVDSYGGQSVFFALDVQYLQGIDTAAQVKLVQADDLEADPALVVLARVDVPAVDPVDDLNVVTDDPAYPRVRPFANQYKPGYMSRQQAQDLQALQQVSGSPALVYETEIAFDGPQDVDLPPGYHYVLGGEDLQVWKNGVSKTAGALRDYIEVDRGDGRGEKITWVGLDLREGDRIKFRIQKYAAHLTSTLKVYDEFTLIDPNVVYLRFVGTGVQVLPDGPRSAKVMIGGGGGGGGSMLRTKANSSGATLQAFRAVRMLNSLEASPNTLEYFDPAVSGHVFYGVTIQDIVNGGFGDVAVGGVIEGVSGISGDINDYLFVQPGGSGELVTTAPDPLTNQVVRVGFLDGATSVSGGGAVDLIFDRGRVN